MRWPGLASDSQGNCDLSSPWNRRIQVDVASATDAQRIKLLRSGICHLSPISAAAGHWHPASGPAPGHPAHGTERSPRWTAQANRCAQDGRRSPEVMLWGSPKAFRLRICSAGGIKFFTSAPGPRILPEHSQQLPKPRPWYFLGDAYHQRRLAFIIAAWSAGRCATTFLTLAWQRAGSPFQQGIIVWTDVAQFDLLGWGEQRFARPDVARYQ